MSLVIALSVGYGAVADIAAETTVSAVSSGSFVPLTPARVLDTRAGAKVGAADGSGAPLTLNVFNKGGLPAGGIGAVALNVTVTQSENPTIGDGFVTVYPCDQPRPDASNLNFVTDQTVPNSVIAPVSANGEVCFYVYGTTHLLAGVSGYFPAGTANRPPVFPDPVDVSYVTNFNYVYGFLVGIVTYLTLKTPCIDPDGDPLTYRWIPPNGTISSDYTSTDALWVRIWDRDFSTGNIRIYGGDLTIECSDPSGTVARHVKTF